jgi:hypothetical protein
MPREKKHFRSCSKPTQFSLYVQKTFARASRHDFRKKTFFTSQNHMIGAVSCELHWVGAKNYVCSDSIGTSCFQRLCNPSNVIVPSSRRWSSGTVIERHSWILKKCWGPACLRLRSARQQNKIKQKKKIISWKNKKKIFVSFCFRQWPPSTALIHTVTCKGYPHRVTVIHRFVVGVVFVHPLTSY